MHAALALLTPTPRECIKKKILISGDIRNLGVSLQDKISNPLLQTLDALSSLYQLITGNFSF